MNPSVANSGAGSPPAPNSFPYIFRLDRWKRKGQRCRVIGNRNKEFICVEFESDGDRKVVSTCAIRRGK